jgi:hypothetical protein
MHVALLSSQGDIFLPGAQHLRPREKVKKATVDAYGAGLLWGWDAPLGCEIAPARIFPQGPAGKPNPNWILMENLPSLPFT